jgi:hypothetical protein
MANLTETQAVHPDDINIGDELRDDTNGRWFTVSDIHEWMQRDHEDPDGGCDMVSFVGADGGNLTVAVTDHTVIHARCGQ